MENLIYHPKKIMLKGNIFRAWDTIHAWCGPGSSSDTKWKWHGNKESSRTLLSFPFPMWVTILRNQFRSSEITGMWGLCQNKKPEFPPEHYRKLVETLQILICQVFQQTNLVEAHRNMVFYLDCTTKNVKSLKRSRSQVTRNFPQPLQNNFTMP